MANVAGTYLGLPSPEHHRTSLVRLFLAVVVASALVGCGHSTSSKTIKRAGSIASIGNHRIVSVDLEGWMAATGPGPSAFDLPEFTACVPSREIAAGTPSTSKCSGPYLSLRIQALGFLIRCAWLVSESTRLGLSAPRALIRTMVESEKKELIARGATAEDVQLKVEAEVAAAALRRSLPEHALSVTSADALSYYRRHRQSFESSERRRFEIAEGLTLAEAHKLLKGGRRIAKRSGPTQFFREDFPRSSIAIAEGEYRVLREAIFSAKPHVLSGPVPLNERYTVFETTHVVHAKVRPFEAVASSIKRLLENKQRVQLPSRFLQTLRSRWMPVTDCAPGYVVQQCRQYSGDVTLEGSLRLD